MSRGLVRTSVGALALSLSLLMLPLPATAAEDDVDQGSVSVSVQIEPRECVTDCGGGAPPDPGTPGAGTPDADLAGTGIGALEPGLWIAMLMLVAGAALFVLRANAAGARVLRAKAEASGARRTQTTARTPYAVRSGELDPSARHTLDGGTAQAPQDRAG